MCGLCQYGTTASEDLHVYYNGDVEVHICGSCVEEIRLADPDCQDGHVDWLKVAQHLYTVWVDEQAM